MSTVKDLEKLIGTKRGKDTKLHLRWQNLNESKVGRRYKRNGTPVTARELIGLYLQAKDIEECERLGLPNRGAEGFYLLFFSLICFFAKKCVISQSKLILHISEKQNIHHNLILAVIQQLVVSGSVVFLRFFAIACFESCQRLRR